ncbi:RNA polymerase factor sigma-54 [Melittangium boletus]|uniref:RNA polymerase sigma-54 factor n=1 Tax=Melittangium boletus DSM 14713 TaxID=1294270 RepID=A0A250IIC7_9BACT|nr:RNA polymerase factor sigma-54 [Melittangium boletus]ATB31028.1 RNA polymerase sigma-54 factor [Melittangium boletus DSM 14713]
MAMELKQSLKLSQQLVMTPQLQQAIKLLQLSRMELLEQVREEMDQNPLLEQPDETPFGDLSDKEPGEASHEAANTEIPRDLEARTPDTATEFKADKDGPPEIDWEAYLNSYQFNEPTTASNKGNVATDDMPSFEANMVEKEDLADHLQEQLGTLRLNEAERRIGMLILGNLDNDGYLKLEDVEGDPLIRLANEADVSMSLAERTLRRIQNLEPKGCAARDLHECLLIQVAALKDKHAPLLGLIIKRHMKYLESKNLPAIAKDLKVTLEEVVEASKLLPKLDPKPGRNFSGDDAQFITPDVFIYKMEDDYTVVLNDDGLSKLRISGMYRNALKNGGVGPGQTKEFIQEKLRSAQWLIRSIHQRQRTIYKVTESIVKFQREFLDLGIAHLKPLILRDVAEDIGMHESTVSRVTTNKYVHTPQGIFELKYFFNSSIARVSGEDTASEAVKHHIKQLVSQEDPRNPYSDQKIVELLKAQGTEIARRTVAKYREVLNILPSSKRKKYF